MENMQPPVYIPFWKKIMLIVTAYSMSTNIKAR